MGKLTWNGWLYSCGDLICIWVICGLASDRRFFTHWVAVGAVFYGEFLMACDACCYVFNYRALLDLYFYPQSYMCGFDLKSLSLVT